MLHETWMVNGPFTYTPSGKKRAPSKELVLTWIDRAWNGIPQDLTEKSFKSCGIANALDGSEDDAVWEEENEETEDAEEIFDNEFETVSEGKEGEYNVPAAVFIKRNIALQRQHCQVQAFSDEWPVHDHDNPLLDSGHPALRVQYPG